MKNLNTQEKKLFSRIAIILAGLVVISLIYKGIGTIVRDFNNEKERDRKELIHKYELKIDSINTVNYMLAIEADSLEKQIVLEQGKKTTIYIETIKKEKEIKDASAAQHAKAIDTLTGQPAY